MGGATTAAFFGGMSADRPGRLLFEPSPDPSKLSRQKWIKAAYARRPDELRAMGITAAAEALVAESQNAADCAKPFEQDSRRYAEKLLRELARELGVFFKTCRGRRKK
jgi:hypothetical protein